MGFVVVDGGTDADSSGMIRPSLRSGEFSGYRPRGSKMGLRSTEIASSKGAIRPSVCSGEFSEYRPSGSNMGLVGEGTEETASACKETFCNDLATLFN